MNSSVTTRSPAKLSHNPIPTTPHPIHPIPPHPTPSIPSHYTPPFPSHPTTPHPFHPILLHPILSTPSHYTPPLSIPSRHTRPYPSHPIPFHHTCADMVLENCSMLGPRFIHFSEGRRSAKAAIFFIRAKSRDIRSFTFGCRTLNREKRQSVKAINGSIIPSYHTEDDKNMCYETNAEHTVHGRKRALVRQAV